MRILVTGGLGFIGTNFIRHMLSEEPQVEIVNLDKMGVGSNPKNMEDLEDIANYTFIKGDISNSDLINSVIKDIDAVVNFAAETHVDRSIKDPWAFVQSNILGTFTLLESIRKHNRSVNFVQVSTDEVYGGIQRGSFHEFDRVNPSNPYSASKASADMLCLAYNKTYGLDVKITRCTNNFGPYQFPEKLIPKTIIRALKNLQVPVYGTGENIRDWIYVLDHCEAIRLVLKNGRSGEIYNISSGNEVPNIKVVKEILRYLGKDEDLISFVEDRPGHDVRYSLDSSKIRSELSWKPRHNFSSALKETVKWYVENESWWRPLATEEVLHPAPWKLHLHPHERNDC
ncbi:dTDP-glucose 4,6-dehydratase [Candidatus Bathyarchaeota archaeon]|nr:MAG: dTDP-glucose 4,6-dehydratase [Candidatus Bathyarchaeota archaeon]